MACSVQHLNRKASQSFSEINLHLVTSVVHVVPVEPHGAVVDPAAVAAVLLVAVDVVVGPVHVRGAPGVAARGAQSHTTVVQAAAVPKQGVMW